MGTLYFWVGLTIFWMRKGDHMDWQKPQDFGYTLTDLMGIRLYYKRYYCWQLFYQISSLCHRFLSVFPMSIM